MPGAHSPSDEELYQVWTENRTNRVGKRAAGQLFQRYFDPVMGYFRRRLGDDVQDVVTETLQAATLGGNFRGESSYKGYVFGIARNKLYAEYRKRSKNTDFDPSVSSLYDLGPSVTHVMGRCDEMGLVAEALRRIPVDSLNAVKTYYREGKTGPEAAELLGISLPALRNRLRRALVRIREEIAHLEVSGEDFEHTRKQVDLWEASLPEIDSDDEEDEGNRPVSRAVTGMPSAS